MSQEVHVLIVTYRDRSSTILAVHAEKASADKDRKQRIDSQPPIMQQRARDGLKVESWAVQQGP